MFSLCMIVKDEAKFIESCIQSAAKYASDIVVVDTGSTDDTKKIAQAMGARVFDFAWVNDFSAARNFAASHANCDWLLALDADEEIISFNEETVEKLTSDPRTVGRVAMQEKRENGVIFTEHLTRFYNRNNFHFTGAIHEQVTMSNGELYQAVDLPIEINHKGYQAEVIQAKNKLERNRVMLEKELENHPNDPYYLYQLGKAYFAMHENATAARYFEKVLAQKIDMLNEYVYSAVECYGYALLQSAQYKKSMEIVKFENLYGKIPEFQFLLGHIYLNNGKFTEAIDAFEYVIQERVQTAPKGLARLAYYNIGVILEAADMKMHAIAYYKKCGSYDKAKERLKAMRG